MVLQISDEIKTPLGVPAKGLVFSFRGKCLVDKDSSGNRFVVGECQVRAEYDYTFPLFYTITKKISYTEENHKEDPVKLLYMSLKNDFPGRTFKDL